MSLEVVTALGRDMLLRYLSLGIGIGGNFSHGEVLCVRVSV